MNKVKKHKIRIYLITGFMVAGKTTSGREAGKLFGFDFIDLDDYIISHENKSINEIFIEKGEEYFRNLETTSFEKLIAKSKEPMIIAAGGGFPLRKENQLLMSKTINIFIDTDFKTIMSRLTLEEKDKRPLIKNLSSNEIKNIYDSRIKIYRETADYIVHDYKELINIISYDKGKYKNEG